MWISLSSSIRASEASPHEPTLTVCLTAATPAVRPRPLFGPAHFHPVCPFAKSPFAQRRTPLDFCGELP
ncbi:hypothetical protein SBA3_1170025 [Candidatus Sulfopaludibacter sp. SbA3]|nr:hypothetical protein SBA3_1170025 [Candidatus Sulfopaludibacter sp. SbA3]